MEDRIYYSKICFTSTSMNEIRKLKHKINYLLSNNRYKFSNLFSEYNVNLKSLLPNNFKIKSFITDCSDDILYNKNYDKYYFYID